MLKDNIDLTSDQFFSRQNHLQVLDYLNTNIFGRIPWNAQTPHQITRDKDLECLSPILLGNRTERMRLKNIINACDSKYCDCCGKYLNAKPWEQQECLCSDCSSRLEQEYSARFPWTMQSEEFVSILNL